MIDYEVLYDGIYDIVSPLCTPLPLIRDYQSELKPAGKYVTMRLLDLRSIGFKEQVPDNADGMFEVRQTYSLTVRFNVIGKGSSNDAAPLHMKLQRPSVIDSFQQLGLFFYDRTVMKDVPKLMSTGFEDRSLMDFKFYLKASDIDDQGQIEHVEVEETYKHQDGTVAVQQTTIIDLVP